MIHVEISGDRLSASIELEGEVDEADLRASLAAAGVVHGLSEERLLGALELTARVGKLPRPLVIAHGEAATPGRPVELELAVELGDQTGSLDVRSLQVDYHERNAVCNVTVGAQLGVLHPAREGVPGCGVDGQELAAPKQTERDARVGAGIKSVAREDEPGAFDLFAELDGVVRLDAKGELSVSELFAVAGDVNLEIGNIDVNGSVQISGGIQTGFRVTARHDIRVAGSIEDATVEAGGTLEVGGGILGGGAGHVKAGERVRASFAQNADLVCGGDVVLGSDTRSTVRCSGELLLEGGAGHLRGGEYWAGRGVRARELGSAQGAPTRVEVGRDPLLAREHAIASKDLRALEAKSRKLRRERSVESAKRVGKQLTRGDAQGVRRVMKERREIDRSLRVLRERRERLEAQLTSGTPPVIRVDAKVYSGVELRIGDASLFIERTRSGGVFRRDPDTGELTSD